MTTIQRPVDGLLNTESGNGYVGCNVHPRSGFTFRRQHLVGKKQREANKEIQKGIYTVCVRVDAPQYSMFVEKSMVCSTRRERKGIITNIKFNPFKRKYAAALVPVLSLAQTKSSGV